MGSLSASSAQPPRRGSIDWVAASDIGAYSYCARMFYLQKVEKVAPDRAGSGRMAAGTEAHAAHGRTIRRGRWAATIGRTLLLVAAGAGALLWLLAKVQGPE